MDQTSSNPIKLGGLYVRQSHQRGQLQALYLVIIEFI